MKTNVDLTEDRAFSHGSRIVPNALIQGLFKFHLWDFEHMRVIHSDMDIEDYHSRLVLCGNATQRQAQRFNISLDTGEICERCGADLTKKPWAKRYCLCQQCHEALEEEFRKLWRFKDTSITESRDRIVIEMNRRDTAF